VPPDPIYVSSYYYVYILLCMCPDTSIFLPALGMSRQHQSSSAG
jgi:hypothetical protein